MSFSSRFCAQKAAFGLSAAALLRSGGAINGGCAEETFASRMSSRRSGGAVAGGGAGAEARAGGVRPATALDAAFAWAAAGALGGVVCRLGFRAVLDFRADGGSGGGSMRSAAEHGLVSPVPLLRL